MGESVVQENDDTRFIENSSEKIQGQCDRFRSGGNRVSTKAVMKEYTRRDKDHGEGGYIQKM